MNAVKRFINDLLFGFAMTVTTLVVIILGIILIPVIGLVGTVVALISFVLFMLFGSILVRRTDWYWEQLLKKVQNRRKVVEEAMAETPPTNAKRLEQLYQEIERLEAKEKQINAETDALIEKANQMIGKKKPKTVRDIREQQSGSKKSPEKFEKAKKDYLESGKMPDFSNTDPIVQDALESGFKAACEE